MMRVAVLIAWTTALTPAIASSAGCPADRDRRTRGARRPRTRSTKHFGTGVRRCDGRPVVHPPDRPPPNRLKNHPHPFRLQHRVELLESRAQEWFQFRAILHQPAPQHLVHLTHLIGWREICRAHRSSQIP